MRGWDDIAAAARNPRVAKALGREVSQQGRRRSRYPSAVDPPISEGLAELWLQMKLDGVAVQEWVYEYQFHSERLWRFDMAHRAMAIAIEYDGLTHGGGRHQRLVGFSGDCEKLGEAALQGWLVIRATRILVASMTSLDQVQRAIKLRQGRAA